MTRSVHRIAMWSGPRNISTAMMRSWGNRPDTIVIDEPFYGHYLVATGIDHPGRQEVITHHETDWREALKGLLAPLPPGKSIFYQKHMAHHLLPGMDRDWLDSVTNCFLIRDPAEMLTSLIKNLPNPRIEDTGLPQQVEILNWVRERAGRTPPILDARDVLENPHRMLGLLCDALGVEFSDAMLSWPAGRRDTDGIWAKHWYAAVEKSTGFEPYRLKNEQAPAELHSLLEQCRSYYSELYALRTR